MDTYSIRSVLHNSANTDDGFALSEALEQLEDSFLLGSKQLLFYGPCRSFLSSSDWSFWSSIVHGRDSSGLRFVTGLEHRRNKNSSRDLLHFLDRMDSCGTSRSASLRIY